MKRTTNYSLPTWEKSDFIQMSDFNDLTHKLDAALKANADAVATKAESDTVTAIAQTIASSKICRAKFGTYTGNGLSGQNHPNSVECGFCPAALVLFRADGGKGSGLFFALFSPRHNQGQDSNILFRCY